MELDQSLQICSTEDLPQTSVDQDLEESKKEVKSENDLNLVGQETQLAGMEKDELNLERLITVEGDEFQSSY